MNLPYPARHSLVFTTENGTPYFKRPGVAIIAASLTDLRSVQTFLDEFDGELEFNSYLDDPVRLDSAEELVKFAGQLCYLSLGPKRTTNVNACKYLDHIKESGHFSVLEHASYTFLCYGISRSLTHELVRHRLASYSQVSQRYVDGKTLRFVERPEYQSSVSLHNEFITRIDRAAAEYKALADKLTKEQEEGNQILSGEKRTELRKKVNQAARSLLPNETEAPIVVSMNARALRHVFEMRVAAPAEIEIRTLCYSMFQCVRVISPLLFDDYKIHALPDGTATLETQCRKDL